MRSRILLATLVLGGGALLAGPASPGPSASPVAKVDVRFTALGGKRPPNVVETRLAGKGTLFFDESPFSDTSNEADRAAGIVVFELDVLTPVPRTVRLELRVTGGEYANKGGSRQKVALYVRVRKGFEGFERRGVASCPAGSEGAVLAGDHDTASNLVSTLITLPRCGINIGQRSTKTATSRVNVTIVPKCLRTVSARKPLCGKPAAKTCRLAGSWSQTTTDVGSTAWVITAGGKAQEHGIGNASGTATLIGKTLTITWKTTNGYAGVYRWTLDATCSGSGTLTFTAVAPGDTRQGKSFPSTVKGPPPK